jgi:hypothetical protein
MEIEFIVRPEDLIAARENYTENSTVMKKGSRFETFGTGSTILMFFAVLSLMLNTYIPFLLGAIFTVVWIFLWPSMQKNSYHRKQTSLYAESANQISMGRKVMELEDDILTVRSELHWSKTKLRAIEQIEITKTHAFLFYGTFQAFVIPRATIQKGDFDQFTSTIINRRDAVERNATDEKSPSQNANISVE